MTYLRKNLAGGPHQVYFTGLAFMRPPAADDHVLFHDLRRNEADSVTAAFLFEDRRDVSYPGRSSQVAAASKSVAPARAIASISTQSLCRSNMALHTTRSSGAITGISVSANGTWRAFAAMWS